MALLFDASDEPLTLDEAFAPQMNDHLFPSFKCCEAQKPSEVKYGLSELFSEHVAQFQNWLMSNTMPCKADLKKHAEKFNELFCCQFGQKRIQDLGFYWEQYANTFAHVVHAYWQQVNKYPPGTQVPTYAVDGVGSEVCCCSTSKNWCSACGYQHMIGNWDKSVQALLLYLVPHTTPAAQLANQLFIAILNAWRAVLRLILQPKCTPCETQQGLLISNALADALSLLFVGC